MTDAAPPTRPVTAYWRPGCPFCSRLHTDLHRTGIPFTEINIWGDPQAATTVRSLAGGNEAVPTLTVGERAMINPAATRVFDAVRQVAPELVTAQATRSVTLSRALRVVQWVLIIVALVVASYYTTILNILALLAADPPAYLDAEARR